MEKNTGLWIIGILVLISMIVTGFTWGSISGINSGLTKSEVKTIVDQSIASQVMPEMPTVPTAQEIADLVVIPEIPDVESADNFLLNEFLEAEFSEEYDEIEIAAEAAAEEELEDHDFRLVLRHLETLFEGIDEDSLDVDVEDVEIAVTKLGLEEDEDKCATVTYELEVEYEFEEGVRDEFEEDLIVVFDVCFDEGDFGDEEVELVSII